MNDDSNATGAGSAPLAKPLVPKLAMPSNEGRGVRSPLSPLSPLSPTGKAMASFGFSVEELKGVAASSDGLVEIDGIPDEDWDIKFSDLVIEKELAEGTFGRVYAGTYFGTKVAVKLLFQVDVVSNIGKYILRELAMLRAVTHPNIVQFLGLCRHKQEVYVVTEYVPRGDLMEVLHSTQHPPLSWSLRVYLMMEITKPLAYLHSRNIVHRDVKLENVLVGQNWSIKLCDFGFARCMDNVETKVRDSRMRKMTVAGTDQWMAPEVLMQQPYNEQADMFSLGCTFYELVCRKQPPTRNVATKYAFDVQEFLYEVPRQTPKELVVLILDMCQLVPMKRPSANRVLERLAEIQQLLPPVDLSEATENHGQSSNPPATSAAILAKTPEQDDETSSSSSVDDSSSAVPTESGDVFLKLQRALSDQSNFETGSNGSAGGHFDVAQTIRRFSVTLKTAAGDMCVDPCWCSVTSSVKPRARKLFVGLLNDGGLHFWKTDKKDEFSKIRVLLEQASAVQHTEKNECLRLTSPLFPGVFWQLEFKNAQIADKWYNAMLGVIMRSDLNYHSRLRSGMHFGWSSASTGPGGSSFFVQMLKPEQQAIVLFVSPQVCRILLPFTEEVLVEWSFSQLSSYLMAVGGVVTLTVARTRLSEPNWEMIRAQGAKTCDFVVSSPLQHKDIYDALERCWRENKDLHDRLFQEVVTSAASPSGARSPGSSLKGQRKSLGFSRSPLEDTLPPRAAKDDTSLPKSADSGLTLPRMEPKKDDAAAAAAGGVVSSGAPVRQKSGTFSFFQRKSISKVDAPTTPTNKTAK